MQLQKISLKWPILFKIKQTNKINFFCRETKPVVSIKFLVAEPESGIRFFPSRQNLAVLPNFMVARPENQFFAFCEKTIRDIENLNTYQRFKIKFCAF